LLESITKQDEQMRHNIAGRIGGRLKQYERHSSTPHFLRRFINFLRLSGDFERRLGREPLRSIPEFRKRISRWEQLCYGSEARNHQAIADALLFAVEYVSGAAVDGDVVEFGTMTGRTATVLAASMAAFRYPAKLHLFDGFAGMPKATSKYDQASYHVQAGVWSEGTLEGISPEALRVKCRRYLADDRIHIYAGWFSDTVPRLPKTSKFSLVHVDCDLYQSTMDALEPLFANGMVSEGAALLFDDWNCNRASRQLGERKAWEELRAKFAVDYSDEGAYGWAGHRMTVHGYQNSSGT
jgi:hypothetical protein